MTRNLRLHRANQTKMLRRDARSRCKFCGTPIEFFDRYDGTRIPLTPEFPARAVPKHLHWHINRGVAYPGSDTAFCRIPHPAVCPAVEHPDLPGELADVVRVLARRMHQVVQDGEFTPYEEPVGEESVAHPEPERVGRFRHIVAYYGDLRLGPCAIEDLRCVAEEHRTGVRCESGVYNAGEGEWARVDIDVRQAKGRQGQLVLDVTGGQVWAWHLVDFHVVRRWWAQRCEDHFMSSRPDAVRNEFVPFHPVRHDAFILTERPTGYDVAKTDEGIVVHEGPRERHKCAHCSNCTVESVPEGWLCWQCEPELRRRARVHRRWVGPGAPGPRTD